jgi:hypothetical protein
MDGERDYTKADRRAEKRRKQRDKMLQHGKGLARVYRDAITRRIQKLKGK